MKIIHGGDLDAAVREYGLKRENIKDFSGNINPFGISEKAKQAIIENVDMVSTYPDVNYLSLKTVIANYVNSNVENIIVGNGSTELISLFIKNFGSKPEQKAIIVAPAYSEYERELKLIGGKCEYFALKEENSFSADVAGLCGQLADDVGLLVICNPNNPTGTAITKSDMEIITETCAAKGIYMLIDETYCEFSDEEKYSSIPLTQKYDNIIVIRGIAKFFSAPGLRLGYGICASKIMSRLEMMKDPWSVNMLAVIAGEQFFTDRGYIKKTKDFINAERKRIYDKMFKWKRIRLFETQTNFQLFKLLRDDITSAEIFEDLIQKGIMIRDAKSFMFLDDSYIRFCFLKEGENTLLLNALCKYCN